MRATILVNPHAGRQSILRDIEKVEKVFLESGAEVTVRKTESPELAEKAVRETISERPDVLVCCGGDGTLSKTVNEVLKSGGDIALGYIPAGTTNDFAHSLGLPKEPARVAERIVNNPAKPLDVGKFDKKYFVYVASFGAFTQSSYNTTQSLKNSIGHLAYILEGIKELPTIKSYFVKVETAEGESFEGEYIFGSLSNTTSMGGVIKLDPAQVGLSDGKFELSLVKMPKNIGELNRILLSLMSGKIDEELITFIHTTGAVFTCAEPMPWSLDGEYAAGGERVKVSVLPGAMRMYY